MIHLAVRNLFQSKTRLFLSTGGTALALLLILSLDAIFSGVEKQITAYIDNSNADVIISQSGVRNLHMATSTIPIALEKQVATVAGVQSVTSLMYLTNVIEIGEERNLAYIIGLPQNPAAGGPWQVSSGTYQIDRGEAIVDSQVADKSGVSVGDRISILGRSFELVGLSDGTNTLVNSLAFISLEDFQELRGNTQMISFILVQAQDGISGDELSKRVTDRFEAVTVQTRDEFASQERQVVRDMSTDVIAIMNLIGFVVGLAVMALSIYTAAYNRRKEFGILKALGARNGYLYQVVLGQAVLSVLFAFLAAIALTVVLSNAVSRMGLAMDLLIRMESLWKVLIVSLLLAGFSAILPIRQLASLDPAMVFRGK